MGIAAGLLSSPDRQFLRYAFFSGNDWNVVVMGMATSAVELQAIS